jgi:hypothetical protein
MARAGPHFEGTWGSTRLRYIERLSNLLKQRRGIEISPRNEELVGIERASGHASLENAILLGGVMMEVIRKAFKMNV